MQVVQSDNGYMVVLARGEKVIESLTAFAAEYAISGAALSGLGAVEDATLCFYDLPEKEYVCETIAPAQEVVAMTGNIALVDNVPFVHAHLALGDRDLSMRGGHLKEATVAVTLEVMVLPFAAALHRKMNDAIGLKLIDTNQS